MALAAKELAGLCCQALEFAHVVGQLLAHVLRDPEDFGFLREGRLQRVQGTLVRLQNFVRVAVLLVKPQMLLQVLEPVLVLLLPVLLLPGSRSAPGECSNT